MYPTAGVFPGCHARVGSQGRLTTAVRPQRYRPGHRHSKVAITLEIISRVVGYAVLEDLVRLHKASYLGVRLPDCDSQTAANYLEEFHIILLDKNDGSCAERW